MLTRRSRSIRTRAPGAGYICFSAQDWWYHNRAHSDFQLMRRIARQRRVLFVNSIGLRMPTRSGSLPPLRRIWRKVRSISMLVRRPAPEVPDFFVMTPVVIPLYHRPFLRKVNAFLVRSQVRAVASALGLRRPSIVVTIPTAADVVDGMRLATLLYNRSDKLSEYDEADRQLIEAMEERLLRTADHVLYVSGELMTKESALTGDRGVFLDHGVDLDHFQVVPDHEQPGDLTSIPRPRVGFFGGLDDYVVDFTLLERVARDIPEASLVLIGDAGAPMERLTAVPNLHWLGFRPYEAIPRYGSGFDVAIMPWLQNEWIRFCNPIKLKEYLALGLPVVSVDYPEGHRYDGLVRWASDHDGFVDQVRRSLNDGGPADPPQRRAAVEDASWDVRAATLMNLAEADRMADPAGDASPSREGVVGTVASLTGRALAGFGPLCAQVAAKAVGERQTRHGAVSSIDVVRRGFRLRLDQSDTVQRHILRTGTYDEPSVRLLEGELRPGDVVLDIGANIGWFAVRLGRRLQELGAGELHAFEPAPDTLRLLERHVRANGLDGVVRIHPVALADREGKVTLRSNAEFDAGDLGTRTLFGPGRPVGDVDVRRGDAFLAEIGVDHADIVKIDVEGAELLVLKGLAPILAGRRPPRVVLVELLDRHLEKGGVSSREIIELLTAHGYTGEKVSADVFGIRTRLRRTPKELVHNVVFRRR